jgi:CTP:molybdopterin cytidylyltransferase MocA
MERPILWAVILAAGESRRMQHPKMLLPFHGKTIIECSIENVLSSGIINVMVVLGAGKDEIISLLENWPVRYCYNEHYKQGMLSSVICGIRHVPGDCDGILIFPGDQPMIPPEAVTAVTEAFIKFDKGLVMPVFNSKRGHPLLIDKRYRNEIEQLRPEEGLRSLAARHPSDVLEVKVDSPGILKDIDTREDYLKELR